MDLIGSYWISLGSSKFSQNFWPLLDWKIFSHVYLFDLLIQTETLTPVMTQGNKNLQKSNCWETNRTKLLRVSHVRHVNKNVSQRNVFFFLGKIQGVADSKLKRTQPKYTTRIKVWLCESWISKKCYHFWDRLYLEEVTNWGWLVLLIRVGHGILCMDFRVRRAI